MLLCSDGLTAGVWAEAIIRTIHRITQPSDCLRPIIALSMPPVAPTVHRHRRDLTRNRAGIWRRIRGRCSLHHKPLIEEHHVPEPILTPWLLVKPPQGGTRNSRSAAHRAPSAVKTITICACKTWPFRVTTRHTVQIPGILFSKISAAPTAPSSMNTRSTGGNCRMPDSIRIGHIDGSFEGVDSRRWLRGRPRPLVADKTIVVSESHAGERPAGEQKVGVVEILSGKTNHPQYRLTKHVSLVGAQGRCGSNAHRVAAPKTAAMISRRGDGYVVSPTESGKRILRSTAGLVHGEHG